MKQQQTHFLCLPPCPSPTSLFPQSFSLSSGSWFNCQSCNILKMRKCRSVVCFSNQTEFVTLCLAFTESVNKVLFLKMFTLFFITSLHSTPCPRGPLPSPLPSLLMSDGKFGSVSRVDHFRPLKRKKHITGPIQNHNTFYRCSLHRYLIKRVKSYFIL